MARTDEEVAKILRELYDEEFGGRAGARYVLSWGDLRAIYGYRKLYETRFERLLEAAGSQRLCVLDLGEGENGRLIIVIKIGTVDRWRKLPKRLVDKWRKPLDDDGDEPDDD